MKKKLTGFLVGAFEKSVKDFSVLDVKIENAKNESNIKDEQFNVWDKKTAKIEVTTENSLVKHLLRP